MADVFISYARSDRPRCQALREALEALRVSVWSDSGIEAGHSFDREIERELDAASAILVLWSADSANSDWVRNEARTGKEASRLVAVQIGDCQLPLEFRSVQAEALSDGGERAADPAWLGVLRRIGEMTGRPGLADYARLAAAEAGLDGWKSWLARNAGDPLVPDAVDRIVDSGAPEARRELAAERAKRVALEAELAEHLESAKAQTGEVASAGRELARARRERDEAVEARTAAESELANIGAGVGRGRASRAFWEVERGSGAGVYLDERLGAYLTGLLWVLGLWFVWLPFTNLREGTAAFSDIFWMALGIGLILIPAVILTIKTIRARRAAAKELTTMESEQIAKEPVGPPES